MTIRLEEERDWREVETLAREAFWNLYVPGCDEHYLAHILRHSKAFIPQLDFVVEEDGKIIANIMYTHSKIVSDAGEIFPLITFGPLCVLPACQKKGYGGALVRHSLAEAAHLGHKAVEIYGDFDYYSRFGFKSAKTFGVATPLGKFFATHQLLELQPGALNGVSGRAYESETFNMDAKAATAFDESFPPKKKGFAESQKRFEEISGLEL